MKKRVTGWSIASLVLLIGLWTDPGARAQGLDDGSWQKRNDLGNRFEGRIDIPVSRPEIQLLSFVGYREDYYEDDVDLRVKFFLSRRAKVSVIAREINEEVQYGMMAKPDDFVEGSWNTWGPWPTGDYLVPNGIPGYNLGVVVLLDENDRSELAPAYVYHSRLPKTIKSYQLVVRPNDKLREISYSISRGGEEVKPPYSEKVRSYGGEAITLDLDVRGISRGPLKIALRGRFADQPGSTRREYVFFHEPLVAGELE